MRSFDIVKSPAPLLAQKCRRVLFAELDYVRSEAWRMMYMMDEAGGVAIAAPQAGIDLRFFVAPVQIFGTSIIINPCIGEYSFTDFEDRIEGCLSLPGERYVVRRYFSCRMEYFDSEFLFQSTVFEGFAARIAQHETQHLDGILIKDHSRKMIL
jgi:peptide deformylase